MWLKTTLLCCCLLACSLVSAKTAEKNGAILDTKPTEAPLMRSTVKPTKAPMIAPQPTKAMVINVPPKSNHGDKMTTSDSETMPELKSKPLEAATTVVKTEQLKTGLRVNDAKPVQVTGFITKSGNIYEIEDKDGIGMIEGRQSQDNMNVCNYGSVVIYSDVPCDEVTNIQVGEVMQTSVKDEKEQSNANNQNAQVTNQNNNIINNNNSHQNDDDDDDSQNNNINHASLDQELDDLDDDGFDRPAPVRRPSQNRRRVQQQQNKRRRRNKNRKSSPNQSNQVNRRRSQAQKNRKRKNQQQNRRRRLQNQNQQQQQSTPKRRRQQNSENRIRPNQQRRRKQTRRGNSNGNTNSNRNGNDSNGSRRGNTNRAGSNSNSKRRRSGQRRTSNQSKRRQHETTNDRRRFDDEYDY